MDLFRFWFQCATPRRPQQSSRSGAMSTKSKLAGAVIAFFPVLVEVEAGHFYFFGWTQTNHCFNDEGNDGRAYYRKHQCDQDGFDLLPDKRLESGVRHDFVATEVSRQ